MKEAGDIVSQAYPVLYTDRAGRKISLFGELFVPQGGGKFPVVVFSHGFNGHSGDFRAECLRFAACGYLCYAFDFCGAQSHGKSVGRTPEEYTPFTMKEDLLAVISKMRRLAESDGQIFLVGGSQGGLVTALAAADGDAGEITALALYFPAFNIPDDWRGKPARTTRLMGYCIGADYIDSVQELDPFGIIGRFGKAVKIVWGDKDELVSRKYIDRAVKAYGAERVDLTILPGAGHGFSGSARSAAEERVLDFLKAHTL